MGAALIGLAACSQDPVAKRDRHVQRAAGYLEKGKLDEAIVELRNALKVDDRFAEIHARLGTAYRRKG